MVPHRTPFLLPLLYPSLTWRIPTTEKELYITFDDGPVNGPTEFVLDTLSQYQSHGTFFCIGDNVRKHPEVFRRIVREGHATGNHTFNHLNGWKNSLEEYLSNTALCETAMAALDGNGRPSAKKLFRPPYGRITRKQIRALAPQHNIVMWDVLSIDYNKNLSKENCLRNTISATRPGSVIVFHDSVKAEKNMSYALPRLLDHFRSQGFVFKPLS